MHLPSRSARACRLLLVCLLLTAVGCLPGKRNNTPPPPDTAVGQDSAAVDTVVAADVAEDAAAADALLASDAGAAGDGDAAAVALPGGCTLDEDCAYIAALVPCVSGVCQQATGLCTLSKKSNIPCDDGDVCTDGDTCKVGKCVGTALVCDDGNQCTDDFCDMATGCTATDNTIPCVAKDPCAVIATCKAGVCEVVKQKDCGSTNPCKVGTCNKSGDCILENDPTLQGKACDDGEACTEDDKCDKGACWGVDKNCDDGNACTLDTCVKEYGKGCEHIGFYGENAVAGCGLQDNCKTGVCAEGKCTLGKSKCDDDNDCTTDTCDAQSGGCTHDKLTDKQPCDDGDLCATDGQCNKGQCFPQKNIDCEDFNPCTADSCDAKTGCQHKAKAGACNDGSACTTSDTCKDGKCAGTPAADGLACGDGKTCKSGVCT